MLNHLTDGNPEGDFKKSTIGAENNKNWWTRGYKANTNKYTKEDMRKAINEGFYLAKNQSRAEYPEEEFVIDILKSLQPPIPTEVELSEQNIIDLQNGKDIKL